MLPVSSIFLVSVQSVAGHGLPEIVIIIPLYIEHRLCRSLQLYCLLSVMWLVPEAYISTDAVRDFRPSTRFAPSLHHHRHLSLHHSVAALSAGLIPLIDDSEGYSVLFICCPPADPVLSSSLSSPVLHLSVYLLTAHLTSILPIHPIPLTDDSTCFISTEGLEPGKRPPPGQNGGFNGHALRDKHRP